MRDYHDVVRCNRSCQPLNLILSRHRDRGYKTSEYLLEKAVRLSTGVRLGKWLINITTTCYQRRYRCGSSPTMTTTTTTTTPRTRA